jgi:hypothetical protein
MVVAQDAALIDARIERITRYPFRAEFHLRRQELDYLASRGLDVMRRHARQLIIARVAAARPSNDGKQTPWGGHPVFRAQHATATCCRRCLASNHDILAGHDLTDTEIDYIVEVICRWIQHDLERVTNPCPGFEADPSPRR